MTATFVSQRAASREQTQTLLYVGRPDGISPDLDHALADSGVLLQRHTSIAEIIGRLQDQPSAVLIDTAFDEAIAVARAIKKASPDTVMIGIADAHSADWGHRVLQMPLTDAVRPPVTARDIVAVLARLKTPGPPLEDGTDRGPNRYGLLGRSDAMREVIDLISRAAATRDGVLITGEPGTGRATVAHAIHVAGDGAPAGFVRVDCARPAAELEQELIGTSDSTRSRNVASPGRRALDTIREGSRLHQSANGQLLLWNVFDLPARLQARLAKILRDDEVFLLDRRGRDDKPTRRIRLKMRVVAVVEGPPDAARAALEEGRIRPDLFKRLATIRIDIPPLRRRPEDIPDLVNVLLDRICLLTGSSVKVLSEAAMTLLMALPWRGNEHEVRALLETLIRRVPGTLIRLDDVLPHVRLEGGFFGALATSTLKDARRQFEHDYIIWVLQHHRGRVPEAAKALGIQRTNLYRKMRALHLAAHMGARSTRA